MSLSASTRIWLLVHLHRTHKAHLYRTVRPTKSLWSVLFYIMKSVASVMQRYYFPPPLFGCPATFFMVNNSLNHHIKHKKVCPQMQAHSNISLTELFYFLSTGCTTTLFSIVGFSGFTMFSPLGFCLGPIGTFSNLGVATLSALFFASS